MTKSNRAAWVCEYCGASGELEVGQAFDSTQCDVCGEPVVPVG